MLSHARTGAAQRLIPTQRGASPPGGTHPNVCRAQYLRAYHTPAAFQAAGRARRTWTDEEALERLRQLTAKRLYWLRTGQKGKVGAFPSYKTAHDERFGSWRCVCELLD
jgi:hypothetical protein